MKNWISKVKYYLNSFIEVGVLLLAVSVIAEVIFGLCPNDNNSQVQNARLESVYTSNRIVGSNPTLSATIQDIPILGIQKP